MTQRPRALRSAAGGEGRKLLTACRVLFFVGPEAWGSSQKFEGIVLPSHTG
jgi:hypothetical protein